MVDQDPFLGTSERPAFISRKPPRDVRQAFEWYQDYLDTYKAGSTGITAFWEIRRYLDWCDANEVDAMKLNDGDLRWYFSALESRCRHFLRGRDGGGATRSQSVPNRCALDLPLNCASCSFHEGMLKLTIEGIVNRIRSFYKWLDRCRFTDLTVVLRDTGIWVDETSNTRKKERAHRSARRAIFDEETIPRWMEGSTEQPWRFTVYWQSRFSLRANEVSLLSDDPHYLDPDHKWFRVPQAPGQDGKRKLEWKLPIDNEARRQLREYQDWKHQQETRVGTDSTTHNRLVIVKRQARPLANGNYRNAAAALNEPYDRITIALGIADPDAKPPIKFTSHAPRRIFTNRSRQCGITDEQDKRLVRGDWEEITALDAYHEKQKRLLEIFPKASPPFGC